MTPHDGGLPVGDEAESLIGEIHAAMDGHECEVMVVDDGSVNGTNELLTRLSSSDRRLVHCRLASPLGKNGAVYTGVVHARGRRIVTLDGDGQNDPSYLPTLVAQLDDPRVGLTAG